jgi:amino acid transporter
MTTIPGPNEVFGPFAIVYLIVFGVGFALAVFLYNDGARWYVEHPIKRRVIRRSASIATTVFGIGLFFFLVRLMQINPFTFGMRLWLWLSALAALIMTAYFVYYVRFRYPALRRTFEDRQQKERYIRPSAGASARSATAGSTAYAATPRAVRRKRR